MNLVVNENQEAVEDLARIYTIAASMIHAKISPSFVEKAVSFAKEYNGAMDLLFLWSEEEDQEEKDRIIADLESHLEDLDSMSASSHPLIKPKIDFDKIESMGINILAFKKKLRAIVDANGGVSELSLRTGITKPSLYRFFDSPSIPRKTTLYKIAVELGLEEKDILFEEEN